MAGIVEKLQKMWNPPDDEYDEYYEDEATEPTADSREEQPSARRSFSSSSSNRVVNINHARAGAQLSADGWCGRFGTLRLLGCLFGGHRQGKSRADGARGSGFRQP